MGDSITSEDELRDSITKLLREQVVALTWIPTAPDPCQENVSTTSSSQTVEFPGHSSIQLISLPGELVVGD